VHLQTVRFESYLFEQALRVSDSSFCSYITFQVMAVSDQSTCHHDTVGPFFEGLQDMECIQLACAGKPDYLHIGRVLHPERPRQISGRIGTVVTTESDDLRFEVGHARTSDQLRLSGEERFFLSRHLLV